MTQCAEVAMYRDRNGIYNWACWPLDVGGALEDCARVMRGSEAKKCAARYTVLEH